jgi:hypothetical protein
MGHLRIVASAVLACLGVCITSAGSAHAVVFDYSTTLAASYPAPSATTPWLEAVLSDTGPNEVTFTLKTLNLNNAVGQYAKQWYFNIDPSLLGSVADESKFSITNPTGVPNGLSGAVEFNGYKADADGMYDVSLLWAGSGDFENGLSSTFKINYSGSGTFNSNSFLFGSIPSTPPSVNGSGYLTLGAVVVDPDAGTNSYLIGTAVPEPSAVWLALGGVIATGCFAAVRRFSRRVPA